MRGWGGEWKVRPGRPLSWPQEPLLRAPVVDMSGVRTLLWPPPLGSATDPEMRRQGKVGCGVLLSEGISGPSRWRTA